MAMFGHRAERYWFRVVLHFIPSFAPDTQHARWYNELNKYLSYPSPLSPHHPPSVRADIEQLNSLPSLHTELVLLSRLVTSDHRHLGPNNPINPAQRPCAIVQDGLEESGRYPPRATVLVLCVPPAWGGRGTVIRTGFELALISVNCYTICMCM